MAATIIVEDGTQVTNANSYISTSYLSTYADERNITVSAAEPEDLLIQAMDYIEQLDFKGYKYTESQSLVWPRSDVLVDGYEVDVDEIPTLLKEAQAEVALSVDAGNGPLDNVDRKKKRVKVGDLEVEYTDNSASDVVVQKIHNKLRKLLKSAYGSSFSVNRA